MIRPSVRAKFRQFVRSNDPTLTFWRVVMACLVALTIWRAAEWVWSTFGLFIVLVAGGVAVTIRTASVIKSAIKHWFDGWRGLNQWPSPYGRHWNEWLERRRREEGMHHADDYYAWLALKMGNRQPWSTWVTYEARARAERES